MSKSPNFEEKSIFQIVKYWGMNEWTFDSGRISIFNSRHAKCRKFIWEKVWQILVLKNAAKEFKNSKSSHRTRKEEKEGKCGLKDYGPKVRVKARRTQFITHDDIKKSHFGNF